MITGIIIGVLSVGLMFVLPVSWYIFMVMDERVRRQEKWLFDLEHSQEVRDQSEGIRIDNAVEVALAASEKGGE